MGTLTDITSTARNKQLRSIDSPMQAPKNAPSQPEGNGKGNFMSPTMASSKRTNASIACKEGPRTSTPTSVKLEKASTAKWMNSAARRVGLRRVGDGTPRSKKEGLKNSATAVTFPDKVRDQLGIPGGKGIWEVNEHSLHSFTTQFECLLPFFAFAARVLPA